MKRGLKVFLVSLILTSLIIVLTGFVIAVHETGHVDDVVGSDDTTTNDDLFTVDENDGGEEENEETAVGEATEDDEEVDNFDGDNLNEISEDDINNELGDGGINSGAFHKVDLFLDGLLQNDNGYSQERAAEIRALIQEGEYEKARELVKLYEESADRLKREVRPEEEKSVKRRSDIIIKGIGNSIKNIPPEYRGEFNQIRVREKEIGEAAQIAAKINDLCNQLIELGEYKKAEEVCKLDKGGDDPKWLRGKKEGWNRQLEGDAQEFFDVLTECMDTTSDGKKGYNCKCGDMPPAQEPLCEKIAEYEDLCNSGDKNACDKSEPLINDFMESLPNNLRVAVEKAMRGFEEEGFERHRPEECREVSSFDRCEEIMFRQRAPGPCLNALDRGEIKPTREACEEIMFRENAPPGCESLNPNECAEKYGGPGRGKGSDFGPGPGIVFQVCDNIEDSTARLACYDANAKGVEITRDYHQGFREEFRSKKSSEDFDPNKFHQKFSEKNSDKYADLYANRRKNYDKYYNNEEDEKRRIIETLDREEACVKGCASQGKAWSFANGKCECSGGDYQQQKDKKDYYNEKPPYNCAVMYCGQNSYCDPYRGCVSEGQNDFYNKPYPQETPCGVGEYFDYGKRRCEVKQDYASQCGSDQHWDAAFRKCVTNCPPGSTWNGQSCMQDTQPTTSGSSSGSCRYGEHWVPEPSNPPNYGYCVSDNYQQGSNTPTTNCPQGTYPEAGTCKSIETTSPPPTTSPPSGETSGTTSPPPSGTGSVISGRAIYENPFLKYYFGY